MHEPLMVDDQITDGKRIAQLLSSELTGLESGALADVSVTDAVADAMASQSGAVAYRIVAREDELATVRLYPEYAELSFAVDPADHAPRDEDGRLRVEGRTVQVTIGAAVKEAVDLIRETAAQR